MKSSSAVTLTAALVLCLPASALGEVGATSHDLRSPDSVTPIERVAPASQNLRSPDSVTPIERTPIRSTVVLASQDLRSPDSVTPIERTPIRSTVVLASQDLRSPDSVTPMERTPIQSTVASAAAPSDVTLPADGGLSTFLILVISFGGAVAVAGAAYGARRLSHAHAGHPIA